MPDYGVTWLEVFNRLARRAGFPGLTDLTAANEDQQLVLDALKENVDFIHGLQDWEWLEAWSMLEFRANTLAIASVSWTAPTNELTVTWGSESHEDWIHAIFNTSEALEPGSFLVRGTTATKIYCEPYMMNNGDTETLTLYQDGAILPSDFERPVAAEGFLVDYFKARTVDYWELVRMRMTEGNPNRQDEPRAWTIFGKVVSSQTHSQNGQFRLLVHPWPDSLQHLKIHYIKQTAEPTTGAETFPIPPHKLEAVELAVLSDWHHSKPGETDPRAPMMFREFMEELGTLMRDYIKTTNRPSIRPREIDRAHYQQRKVY
jgi:hypothetical protein